MGYSSMGWSPLPLGTSFHRTLSSLPLDTPLSEHLHSNGHRGLTTDLDMDTCCADYCLNLVASTTINQKLPIRTGRAPPDSDGQRQQPVDPWHPPMVAIGENSLDGYNAVSYQSWLGPEDMRLREEPSKQQKQVLLDFAVGKKLFPLDLLEASAENRYNWQ